MIFKQSPNHTKGRQNPIKYIVLHWIGMGTAESAANYLCKETTKASAHYILGPTDYQLVKEEDTAWHAGQWDMNTQSIGIEHEATPDFPATEETYRKSAQLVKEICKRYNIPVDGEHIIKHSSVVATQCPGSLDVERIIRMAQDTNWEELAIRYKSERDAKDIKLEDCRDEREKEKQDSQSHIEELQKTVSELNQINSSLVLDKKTWLNEKKELEDKLLISTESLSDVLVEVDILKEEKTQQRANLSLLEGTNNDLSTKLRKKLKSYTFWDFLKSRF